MGLLDEAVHRAAVDVGDRVGVPVRPAPVHVARVVERPQALLLAGLRHADVDAAVADGEAVGAREGAEVAVERAVLLHHHHDVLDAADPGVGRLGAGPALQRLDGGAATADAQGDPEADEGDQREAEGQPPTRMLQGHTAYDDRTTVIVPAGCRASLAGGPQPVAPADSSAAS